MNYIHERISTPLPEDLIHEFESVDKGLCKLMEEAEGQYHKLHMDSIPWSPEYSKASIILEYWLQRRSYLHGLHHNVRS